MTITCQSLVSWFLLLVLPCFAALCLASDTILQGQFLRDSDSDSEFLISANKEFTLKFFSFGASKDRYLGIFPDSTSYEDTKPVWVANRDDPIGDDSGILVISATDGLLHILHSGGDIILPTNSSAGYKNINTSATLEDNGNLVLRQVYPNGSSSGTVLWQSFDYPADVLLPVTLLKGGELLRGDLNGKDVRMGFANNSLPKCEKGENFSTRNVSYGNSSTSSIKEDYNNLTLIHCKDKCTQNCSCSGYASLHENGTGCEFWDNDNVHSIFSDSEDGKRHVYIRDTPGPPAPPPPPANTQWRVWLISSVGGTLLLIVSIVCIKRNYCMKENLTLYGHTDPTTPRREHVIEVNQMSNEMIDDKKMGEIPLFRFETILMATKNFCEENKLGEGGFGPVFRGKLVDGQEVAVKKLARSSSQGLVEFQNEVQLIIKLQHNNLVRLLGCCIHRDEMMLVYEYLPNKSLDYFLFDSTKKGLLKWENRMNIIEGIAQGLLYLHKHSRLRVIHRDLKASNILLDLDMKPKISDFGIAKILGVEDIEESTKKVIGTRGYMAPEYIIHGVVSTKIDVFSFGVLVLEIVSSKRNYCSYNSERDLNLVGLAWELWNEGRALDLTDTAMHVSDYVDEVQRCISVGLLCVQDNAADRPSMEDVIFMLRNESIQVPMPKRPAFFSETFTTGKEIVESLHMSSSNNISTSIFMEAR